MKQGIKKTNELTKYILFLGHRRHQPKCDSSVESSLQHRRRRADRLHHREAFGNHAQVGTSGNGGHVCDVVHHREPEGEEPVLLQGVGRERDRGRRNCGHRKSQSSNART